MLPKQLSARQFQGTRAVLFALCLLPLARLVAGYPLGWLGTNPIELITRSTGTWTLVLLLVTLAVTPLRHLTGAVWFVRLRRMLGLFAFFYATLHLTTYVWFDQFFDWAEIGRDIVKRPFITLGMAAFTLLVPLAITSNNAMIKRLGATRWQRLHRLVYMIGVLAVLHYLWLVKRDITQPMVYGAVLAVLLGWRFVRWLNARRSSVR